MSELYQDKLEKEKTLLGEICLDSSDEPPHLPFPLWIVLSRMSSLPCLWLGCERAALVEPLMEGPQGWLGGIIKWGPLCV